MVTITDAAKEELGRILDSRAPGIDKCLRLAVSPMWHGPGEFGIVIDAKVDGDCTVELDDEEKFILVDSSLAERLSDSVLDFVNTPDGSRFTLDVF